MLGRLTRYTLNLKKIQALVEGDEALDGPAGVDAPGPLFEGNPVAEGTTRRGTATPVHRPQRPDRKSVV